MDHQEQQDWITFFKRAHRMSQADVDSVIKIVAVLKAFTRATLAYLPKDVKAAYQDQKQSFDQYSQQSSSRASCRQKRSDMLNSVLRKRKTLKYRWLSVMLKKNRSLDDVASVTELPVEVIKKLHNNMK